MMSITLVTVDHIVILCNLFSHDTHYTLEELKKDADVSIFSCFHRVQCHLETRRLDPDVLRFCCCVALCIYRCIMDSL